MEAYGLILLMNKYVAEDGRVWVDDGSRQVVIISEDWDTACSVDRLEFSTPRVFRSVEAAENYARKWKGHPWWIKEAGWSGYEVVKLKPVMKQVGWKATKRAVRKGTID